LVECPIALALGFSDMVKEIDVLGLALSLERLFQLFEGHRLIMIDSNKPAVREDGPPRLWGGGFRVVRMGDSNMEFRHTQGLGHTRGSNRGRHRLCSTIGVASANRLTESCNGPGCHGGANPCCCPVRYSSSGMPLTWCDRLGCALILWALWVLT
jgi:hypothetical protein